MLRRIFAKTVFNLQIQEYCEKFRQPAHARVVLTTCVVDYNTERVH